MRQTPAISRLRQLLALAAVTSLLPALAGCNDAPAPTLAEAAADYRADLRLREKLGTIEFPPRSRSVPVRAGLDQEGVDRGPAWFQDSMLPGEGGPIYVAGHRTTQGGPFRPVGSLRAGDEVIFRLPYAVATYEVIRRGYVEEENVGFLDRGSRTEQLRLQTSTLPQSSRRLIVFANLSAIEPR